MARTEGPTDLLRVNLDALRARDPRFVEEITRDSGTEAATESRPAAATTQGPSLHVEPARSGEPTARIDGVLLHSRFDPRREAERVVNRYRESGTEYPRDATVLCGFGLGYHLEALLEAGEEPVVVVEPDRRRFLSALVHRDLRNAFADPRTNLVIGQTVRTVIELLKTIEVRYPDTLRLQPVTGRSPDYFEELLRAVESFRKRNEVNANTLTRFGKLWIRNLLINLPKLAVSPGLNILEGVFSGFPVLLVAAGPTLDNHYVLLRELKKRCVLLAVDTALPLLERHGIEADIVVVVDPQYWNTRHLDYAGRSKPLLLAEPSTHPRVLRLLPLTTLFSGSFFPLGQYMEATLPPRKKLGAGGSVATSAWDAARIAGARDIYTVGLDLGFPGAKTHARGSFFEERGHTLSHRLAGMEEYAFRYLRSGEPFLAEDSAGNALLSDRRMQMYASWFESQATLYPEIQTYTLDSGSLEIKGRPFRSPRELLAHPDRRAEIDERLTKLRGSAEAAAKHSSGRMEALRRAAEDLEQEIERIEELSRQGRRLTERLLEQLHAGGDLTGDELRSLDDVDNAISAVPNRDVLGFLMQEVDKETRKPLVAGARSERLADTLNRSSRIYGELEESAGYHRALFAKLLVRSADKKNVE